MSEFFFTLSILLWLSSLLLCCRNSPSSTVKALRLDVIRCISGVDFICNFLPWHLLELFNFQPRLNMLDLTRVPTSGSVQFVRI